MSTRTAAPRSLRRIALITALFAATATAGCGGSDDEQASSAGEIEAEVALDGMDKGSRFELAVGDDAVWAIGTFDGGGGPDIIDPHVGTGPDTSTEGLWQVNPDDNSLARDPVELAIEEPITVVDAGDSLWTASGDQFVTRIDSPDSDSPSVKRVHLPDRYDEGNSIAADETDVWVAGDTLTGTALWKISLATNEVKEVAAGTDLTNYTYHIATGGAYVWLHGDEEDVVRVEPETGSIERVKVGFQGVDLAFDGSALWVGPRIIDTELARIDAESLDTTDAAGLPQTEGAGIEGVAAGDEGVWVSLGELGPDAASVTPQDIGSGAHFPGTASAIEIDPETAEVASTTKVRDTYESSDIGVGAGAVWMALVDDATILRIGPG